MIVSNLDFLFISPRIGAFCVYWEIFLNLWKFAKNTVLIATTSGFLVFLHELLHLATFGNVLRISEKLQQFSYKLMQIRFFFLFFSLRIEAHFSTIETISYKFSIIGKNLAINFLHELAHLATSHRILRTFRILNNFQYLKQKILIFTILNISKVFSSFYFREIFLLWKN